MSERFGTARWFLPEVARTSVMVRVQSLRKDVEHCLVAPFAPFPALLYCLATIDYLGALASGNAKSGTTAKNARQYMREFIGYSDEHAWLIQGVFRHKLVHLAQPTPIVRYQGRILGWGLAHRDSRYHRVFLDRPPGLEGRLEQVLAVADATPGHPGPDPVGAAAGGDPGHAHPWNVMSSTASGVVGSGRRPPRAGASRHSSRAARPASPVPPLVPPA